MTKMILIMGDDETIAKLAAKIEDRPSAPTPLRIVGLFHVMRTRCSCPDDLSGRHHGKLSTLGPRFRWWVHRKCGKPTTGLHRVNNLLEDSAGRQTEGPKIVIDSVSLHDYGFYNDER